MPYCREHDSYYAKFCGQCKLDEEMQAASSTIKQIQCDHEGYDFTKHGRCCPNCNKFMVDFGD